MERDTLVLLAASNACGASSDRLGAWLRAAGTVEPDRLLDRAVLQQARIGPDALRRFRHNLNQPRALVLPEGWRPCSILDAEYPSLLATLDDAPGVLYINGNTTLLHQPQIAIVGARGASPEGLDNARAFARALAQAGLVVTSGLALGIDGAAHWGALERGTTIAVLGNGPGDIYPRRHRRLAEDIARNGALVTEFPPGLPSLPAHFPSRNRIIAGLSLATVVVEAAPRSGSLITARLAAGYGREVFAVPGSVHNPLAKGCHQLLRDGANWLESVDDVLAAFDAFHALAGSGESKATDAADPFLSHFRSGVNSLDALVQRTGLSVEDLSAKLFELEMSGAVERVPGGYSRRFA